MWAAVVPRRLQEPQEAASHGAAQAKAASDYVLEGSNVHILRSIRRHSVHGTCITRQFGKSSARLVRIATRVRRS